MRTLLCTLFLCFTAMLGAQSVAFATVEPPVRVETTTPPAVQHRFLPAFPGGHEAFRTFLDQELRYPELAIDYAVEGTVVVRVMVAPSGAVTAIGVEKSLFGPLDDVALAAVAKLPRMLPAVEDGQPVARTLLMPFKFSLR